MAARRRGGRGGQGRARHAAVGPGRDRAPRSSTCCPARSSTTCCSARSRSGSSRWSRRRRRAGARARARFGASVATAFRAASAAALGGGPARCGWPASTTGPRPVPRPARCQSCGSRRPPVLATRNVRGAFSPAKPPHVQRPGREAELRASTRLARAVRPAAAAHVAGQGWLRARAAAARRSLRAAGRRPEGCACRAGRPRTGPRALAISRSPGNGVARAAGAARRRAPSGLRSAGRPPKGWLRAGRPGRRRAPPGRRRGRPRGAPLGRRQPQVARPGAGCARRKPVPPGRGARRRAGAGSRPAARPATAELVRQVAGQPAGCAVATVPVAQARRRRLLAAGGGAPMIPRSRRRLVGLYADRAGHARRARRPALVPAGARHHPVQVARRR